MPSSRTRRSFFPFTPAAACLFAALLAATTIAQTTQPLIARESAHLERVMRRLEQHPRLARDPYVRLEIAVAKRFLDRLRRGGGKGDNVHEWAVLQTDEIAQVLDHTGRTIDRVESGELAGEGLGSAVPVPTGGPVKIEDGVFVTPTLLPGETQPTMRPFYFGGFGHFGQVVEDLPNFAELAVTIIQDGRNGPAQGLTQERTLSEAGMKIRPMLARAVRANVKVDILTSPHYFPDWAVAEAPDMANGTPYHNIDHPRQREIIENWLTQVARLARDEPAVMSYCLSNEPVYSASGRDAHSAGAWHDFLRERHGTIEKLNALYESSYARFEDVRAGGWKDDPIGRRHAFDWVSFNDAHFAGWHRWMGDVLKPHDPDALTHAKIMVFFALDHDKAGWGIDPEQFCAATDIAGCDAYAQIGSGVGPLDESTPTEYAYHWQVQEMCYDLLHSFGNQPVFNSENHPMPNATGAHRWPAAHTRAVMWQGGLHHQGATTTWAWEEASHDSLLHTIYFRPAHVWAHGRAMLDLNRLSAQVTAINRAPATVAILYSPASRFWQSDYAATMRTAYTALTLLGEKVTFVSERQIAEGRAVDVPRIVVPHATHVTDATFRFLADAAGPQAILIGKDCLAFDDYNRPRTTPAGWTFCEAADERTTAAALREVLGPRRGEVVEADSGAAAWGVEFRIVEHEGRRLVPLINMMKTAQTVSLKLDGAAAQAQDLLSQRKVALATIALPPMEPMLLEVMDRPIKEGEARPGVSAGESAR